MTKKKIIVLLVLIVVISVSIAAVLSRRRAIVSGDAEVRELETKMERMGKEGVQIFDEEGELTDSGAEFLDRIGKLGERKKTPPWMLKRFASKKTHWLYRHMLSEIIAEQKDPAVVDTLIRVMRDKGDNEGVRGDAAFTLGMIGDERAIEPLIEALQDESVRIDALRALGMFEDERAIEPLRDFLKSRDRSERNLAARALKGDNPNIAKILIPLAKDDPDEIVRGQALRSLGTTKDEEAFQFLTKLLEDEDTSHYEQNCAIEALGDMGDRRAVDLLIKVLREGRMGLYRDAAEALAKIGDKSALEAMQEVMRRETTSKAGRKVLKRAYEELSAK